ncbi:hypothetical protein Tco_0408904 [Tanacetum coccineum]
MNHSTPNNNVQCQCGCQTTIAAKKAVLHAFYIDSRPVGKRCGTNDELDDYVLCKIYNRAQRREKDIKVQVTNDQQPRVDSIDLHGKLPTILEVENELIETSEQTLPDQPACVVVIQDKNFTNMLVIRLIARAKWVSALEEVATKFKLLPPSFLFSPSFDKLGPRDMSNSDELRHTDNTTLVPPRFPDTLPQVYHRRRPTLGLLILPSVSPFPPTIRRTARISIPPIEPNLAERARISAINLDDYQLDPVTPPPSPSSPFTMAAYQRMIAETDPTQREEALTETGQNSVPVPETALTVCTTRLRGQLHTILEDMDRYPNACLEELEAFMTLWDDIGYHNTMVDYGLGQILERETTREKSSSPSVTSGTLPFEIKGKCCSCEMV